MTRALQDLAFSEYLFYKYCEGDICKICGIKKRYIHVYLSFWR